MNSDAHSWKLFHSMRRPPPTLRPGNGLQEDVKARVRRARLAAGEGRVEEAAEIFGSAIGVLPPAFDSQFEFAKLLLRVKRLDEAITSFGLAASLWPEHADAHFRHGLALMAAKRTAEGIEAFMRSAALEPARVAAQFELGRALAEAGRASEAARAFDVAASLAPKDFDIHFRHGLALMAAKAWTLAADAFNRAIVLRPNDFKAHFEHGRALMRAERPAEAVKSFDRASSLDAGHFEAHLRHGMALAVTKRWEAAIAAFDHALTLRPNHFEGQFERGRALISGKRIAEALEAFTRACALDPKNTDARLRRAGALLALKRRDEAIEELKRVAELRPDDPKVRLELARAQRANVRAKGPRETGRSAAAASAEHPKPAPLPESPFKLLFDHARALMGARRYAEAVIFLDDAAKLEPLTTKVHLEKGKALAALKRYSEAEEALAVASRIEPFRIDVKSEVAKVLVARQKMEEACNVLARAVRLAPTHFDVGLQHAKILSNCGRLAEARAELKRLEPLATSPKALADLYHSLATLDLTAGEATAGVALLDQALSAKPGHVGAAIALAKWHLSTGAIERALRLIDDSLALNPGNGSLLYERGVLSLARADRAGALTAFSAVARQRQNGHSAELLAAQAAKKLNLIAEAEELLKLDLDADPDSVQSLIELGRIFSKQRRPEEAFSLFLRATQLAPLNHDALHGAGSTARALARPGDSIAYYQRVLEIAPGRTQTRLELGVAYETLGEMDSAHRSYSDAVEAAPRSVDARLALARMEYELGATTSALAHCKVARDLAPEDARVNAYLHLLEKAAGRTKAAEFRSVVLVRRPDGRDLDRIAALSQHVQEILGDFSELGSAVGPTVKHVAGGWRESLSTASFEYLLTVAGDVPAPEMVADLCSRAGNRIGLVQAECDSGSADTILWRTDLLRSAAAFHRSLDWPELVAEAGQALQKRQVSAVSPPLHDRPDGGRNREAWLISSSGAKLFGGVEHFLRSMVPLFRDLGFDPVIVGLLENPADADPTGVVDGIPFANVGRSASEIRNLAFARRPAIALATTGIGYELMAALDGFATRLIYGTHFWRDMFHGEGSYENVDLIGRPRVEFRTLLAGVDQAYSNSVYTREAINRHFGVSQPIVFSLPFDQPPLKPDRTPGEYVLLMNGRPDKGFTLTLEIARKVPETTFRVVASQVSRARIQEQIKQAGVENIEIQDWTEDTATLYKSARAVLVPSYAFVETFSRVVIEAQRFGIPVLGSNRGNVATLLAPLGLALAEDPQLWADVIRRLCTDDAFWHRQSEEARRNADRYAYSGQKARVQRVVQAALGRVAVGVGSGIGNIIQATPAIRRISEYLGRPVDVLLREDFPGCASLLEGSEWIGTVITSDADALDIRYDAAILFDCYGQLIPRLNAEVVYVCRRSFSFDMTREMHEADFNLMCARELMGIPYQQADIGRYFIGGFSRGETKRGRIGLHAGSKGGIWSAKQWPYFQELSRRLQEEGYETCSFGAPTEHVEGTIDLTGTDLATTIRNIAECSHFVANDSGLMHIADALQVPLTTMFAPTSVVKNGPLSATSRVVKVKKDCSPCQFDAARMATCRCIREISREKVYNLIMKGMPK